MICYYNKIIDFIMLKTNFSRPCKLKIIHIVRLLVSKQNDKINHDFFDHNEDKVVLD